RRQFAHEVGDGVGGVPAEAWPHEDAHLHDGDPMPRVLRRMAPARTRRGMTLIEIMISLVLLGIVSGVIMRVVMRQQRFYQGVNQILTQRGQLRQATGVVPSDLRSLSSVGGDIIIASDSSMEFMMNVGTGVVCELVLGGTKVIMPPEVLFSGQSI